MTDKRPNDRELNRHERDMTEAVAAELSRWRAALLRGINSSNVDEITRRLNDPALTANLRDVLVDWLRRVAEFGVSAERGRIEKDVLGVKGINELISGVAWDLANDAAAEWAIWYGTQLAGEIAKRTSPRIQSLVADWIRNSESLAVLIDRIQDNYLFSFRRAQTIAVTEVTRAYARGNQETWRAAGIIQRQRWQTANDEAVCPICGPLHNQVVGVNESWPGGIDSPPAHPNCRCFVTGVTEMSEDRPTGLQGGVGNRQPVGVATNG